MKDLWVYERLSRFRRLGYRGKMMLVAFVGTHIPLLALIAAFVLWLRPEPGVAVAVIGVALAATLAGTATTLVILDHLLRPIVLASRALRRFVLHRELPHLPTRFADTAGTLMADTATSLVQLDRALDALAHYDPVTGLPNRAWFEARLTHRLAELDPAGPVLAVCGLRLVNHGALGDSFERAQVDTVLRALGARLSAVAGAPETLARVEPGTFAFWLEDAGDVDALSRHLAEIAAAAGDPVIDGALRVLPKTVTAATLAPSDGDEARVLLDHLANALAAAGAEEGAAPASYSAATRARSQDRFLLEQDLRRAVEDDQLCLHFQPIVDAAAERVIGAVALVR